MEQKILDRWETQFAQYLQAHADNSDGAHDLGHFRRVWRTASGLLHEHEEADPLIVLAAAYFHDIISLPKNHPEAHQSSRLSAEKAGDMLKHDFPDFPMESIDAVKHAIQAHSYSAGIPPVTIEAKILQDADRMEALGAIGIARTFYTAGRLGTNMFSAEDPQALHRELNDKLYALDHFRVKLLKLPSLMNTAAGQALALRRTIILQEFMEQMIEEIGELPLRS